MGKYDASLCKSKELKLACYLSLYGFMGYCVMLYSLRSSLMSLTCPQGVLRVFASCMLFNTFLFFQLDEHSFVFFFSELPIIRV